MGVPVVVSFAVSAVTSIASYYLTTKEIEGPRLDSTSAPTSTYGQGIPKVYGKSKVAGNLIWTKKIREERTDGNKKKGIPSEYKYYGTFAVLLCEGVVNVLKIWCNGKLVYDIYSPSGETQNASSKFGEYIKIYNGYSDQQADPTIQSIEGADRTPAFKGKAYIVFNDLPLKEFSNGIPSILCEVLESENPLLSTLVTDICKKAGIPESKINTTELGDIVTGFVVPNNGESYKDSLEQLAKAYFFYITQDRNGILLFRKIQRPIVSTAIALNELGTRDAGNDLIDIYKKIHIQNSELPTSLSVSFRNPNLRYNNDTQIVQQSTIENDSNSISFDFNLSLFRTEARYLALILLAQFWIRRNRYEEISLSPKWINSILPGDVVHLALNDLTIISVQIESMEIGANYQINLKCVEFDGGSFTPPAITVEEEIRYEFISDPSTYGSATLYLLDLPIFDNRTKQSGYYAMASAISSEWKNGSLFVSVDEGNSYSAVDTIFSPSAIGTVTEALPVARTDVIDKANQITVTLENSNPSYQLFSSSDVPFLNGEVLALVGSEIISFKNAELIAQNTYKLSYFIRGLFRSDISSHQPNEKFILLKGGTSATNVFNSIAVGQSIKAKLVGQGELIENVPIVDFFYNGKLYEPYTPFHIEIKQFNTEAIVSWFRRTNFQNETGFSFDIQLCKTNGDIQKELTTTATFFSISIDELFFYFSNEDTFLVKIREINNVKYGEWREQILPLTSPYLFDNEGNQISSDDNLFILY